MLELKMWLSVEIDVEAREKHRTDCQWCGEHRRRSNVDKSVVDSKRSASCGAGPSVGALLCPRVHCSRLAYQIRIRRLAPDLPLPARSTAVLISGPVGLDHSMALYRQFDSTIQHVRYSALCRLNHKC